MAGIFLPRRTKGLPRVGEALRLNARHRRAKDLAFAYRTDGSAAVGLSHDSAPILPYIGSTAAAVTGAPVLTPMGMGVKSTLVAPCIFQINESRLKTNTYTFIAFCTFSGSSIQNILDDDDGNNRKFQFRVNASGKVEFILFNTSSGNASLTTANALTAAEMANGFMAACSMGPAGMKVYQNRAVNSVAFANAATGNGNIYVGNRKGGYQQYGNGAIVHIIGFAAQLEDWEVFSFLDDPGQINLPQKRQLIQAVSSSNSTGQLPSGTATMSHDLTLTSATFNPSGKFGSSLNGGYGIASPNPLPTTGAFTIEAWVKGSTTNDYFVVAGSEKGAWMGQTNTGKAWAYYGTTDATITSTVSVSDGASHHWSFYVDPTGATASKLYIDGVLVGSITAARTLSLTAPFGVKAWGNGGATSNIWPGEVDEVTIYSGMKRSANFTPPVAATSNSDANLIALWHLDGNGTDSAGLPDGTKPNAPTIGAATAGNNQVSVAFTPSASGTAASSFTAVWSGGGTATGTASPLTITGLTAGTAGTVHVYASNSYGNSDNSAESNSVTPTAAPQPVVVPFTDARIFWSPYNWDTYSTFKSANNPHAYAKLTFTGTSIAIGVDVSALVSASQPAASYPVVRTIIDGTSQVDTKLTSGTTSISRTGLAAGTHTFEMYFLATDANTGDRWTTPVNALRVTGFTLDVGASASAPTLRTKRHLHFGDSISEGYMANGAGTVQPESNNCLLTVPPALAQMFDAEYGVVAFSGQGYQQASGNVPALLSSWNLYSAGRSRLADGLLSPAPDYITIEHGANGTTTSANVQTLLSVLRTAAPQAKIFQMVTRGGYARAAVVAGEAAVNDPNAYIIDLGTAYQTGVSNYTATPNMYSVDGLHPNPLANMRAAAGYADKIQLALDGTVAAPTLYQRTFSLTLATGANADGSPILAASWTNIRVAFFDEQTPNLFSVPRYQSSTATTDANGVMSLTVQSTLASGASGCVVIQTTDNHHFNAIVQVT